ncbi:MAG: DegT/DnrJ/EryC1/StrS family aminotransferase [Polyangiaceae bacterium]
MRVPFLDLSPSIASRARLLAACARVVDSGRYIGGPEVERFEAQVAEYLGAPHAVACSSGSDALVIALTALGVGHGDEVVLPAFSFFATAESVVRVGAVPRFVDIELDTLGADPAGVARAVSSKTRAILAVHIAGTPAPLDALRSVAQAHSLPLIEDAAQAFGARWQGQALGTFGDVGCFSFQATKPLGALGDAGLLVCADAERARLCRRLTLHGAQGRHEHTAIGGNYRMDALHAAMLSEKLAEYPDGLGVRERIAHTYSEGLAGLAGLGLPLLAAGSRSCHSLYTLRVEGEGRRDALGRHLTERGVETSVYYPTPLYRQEALVARGYGLPPGSFPNVELACRQVLSLPIHSALAPAQVEHVIDSTRAFFLA